MSTPRRFFIDCLAADCREVWLEGEEFVHARNVLRVEEGAEIVLLDGSGKEYSAIVARIEKKRLLAHITGVNAGEREPRAEIYLLCGALKGDKTELVVQKATELGASKIGVFNSEYCSAYMNENKLERLNKVAREAAKQCLRSRAPSVEYFDDFTTAMKSAERSDGDMAQISGSAALVVGSEGGFTEDELGIAQSLGFAGISLGKRILRAETAAIAMCALAAFALGELK